MNFIIPAEILGASFSLLVKDDGSYEKFIPSKFSNKNVLVVNSKEYWEKIKLYGLEPPFFPPQKFINPYKDFIKSGKNVPWTKCIPKGLYKKHLLDYIDKLRSILSHDFSYYDDFFSTTNLIFNDLVEANINLEKYNTFITDPKNKNILRSFTPIHFNKEENLNLTDKVVYNRLASKTGRLTVTKGPQILLLKREYRKILKSRYENGGIFYLDYKSLEPRVLLASNFSNREIPKDIYLNAIKDLGLEGKVDRSVIKTALISAINGAGKNEIAKQLNKKVDYPNEFIELVHDYFGLEELKKRVSDEYHKNDGKLIYNHYGRPITCSGTAPYILLNYFIQSTAVDVALLGFNKIWTKIVQSGANDYIKPLFILHDALILDASPKLFHLLPKIASYGTSVHKFKNVKFWIEIERLA